MGQRAEAANGLCVKPRCQFWCRLVLQLGARAGVRPQSGLPLPL